MPTITGTDSGETLAGTTGDDQISGLAGNDTINLSAGHDTIDGGAGTDMILGTPTTLPGLPQFPRNYLITADHISDGSGTLDTSFTSVERVQISDVSGYDVTVDSTGFGGALTVSVGAGSHLLTGSTGNDLFALNRPGGTAVVNGGAGTDTLAFVLATGSLATVSNSGGSISVNQDGVRSAEMFGIELISIFGTSSGGLMVDASQATVSLTFNTTQNQADTIVGSSAADRFRIVNNGAGDVLSGGGEADVFEFVNYAASNLSVINGSTILDLDSGDTIDLSQPGVSMSFIGEAQFSAANQYRNFTFGGRTFIEADGGMSLLTIANGAFLLAETGYGSDVLHIAAVKSAPDAAPTVATGTAGEDVIETGAGNDQISALEGDDLVGGGAGNDQIDGGRGHDTIFGGAGADTIDGGEGFDTIRGEDGNDTLTGLGFEADWMMGGRGDDTLLATGGVWHLYGGDDPQAGWPGGWNPRFGGEDLSAEDDGNDRITLTNGYISTIDGGSGNDLIRVIGGSEIAVVGGSGNDTIQVSGATLTALDGGAGDDLIYVDDASDVVVETVGNGNDRVFAGVSYALGAGVEVERLTTSNNAGTAAINLTGNELVQTIYGNAGANVLNGGGGADTLIGLGGDDWYYVDNALDRVSEGAADGANDRVLASTNWTLTAGAYVERLTTTDNNATTAINLTGNELANVVYGNAGANVLDGKAGNDALTGLAGNDTLIGGAGNDTLSGGLGDDWYYIDSTSDIVVEVAGQGTGDRILTSVSYTLAAGIEIERLTTDNNAGTSAINLTGSAVGNLIYGNAGANILDGRGGADTLVGFGGNDSYYVDNALDLVTEAAGEGTDRIFASMSYTQGAGVQVETLTTTNNAGTTAINLTGNELANTIYGNAGANVLDGKGGADTLIGLAGADTFAFTTALGAGNVDTVSGFVVADDTIRLENAVFTGLAVGALSAGAFNTGASATQADDRIVYNSATGALLFDADGSGAGAAVQFATLAGGLALTSADFLVV